MTLGMGGGGMSWIRHIIKHIDIKKLTPQSTDIFRAWEKLQINEGIVYNAIICAAN